MSAEFPDDHRPAASHAGRAKRLLLTPADEWRAIDAETTTVGDIVKGWVLPLAAIGPVAGLVGGLVFGHSLFGVTYRPGIATALGTAVAGYVAAVVGTIILAYIIDALAPSFDGTKDRVQAMKVAAYSATAAWLAGIFQVLPAVAWLGLLGLYSLYLLYVGLPLLMRAPAAKALGYTVVTVIAAVLLFVVVGMVTASVGRMLAPAPLIGAGAGGGSVSGTVAIPGVGTIDVGKMEEAARKMEAATNTPRTAVAPDVLQGLLPATLGGWQRTEVESSGASAGGLGGSRAEARYERGDDHFRLEVTDIAAVGALASLGGALNVQSNKQTATGYEKTGIIDGRMTTEEWDTESREGKYGVLVAERFMVEAEGNVPGIDTLKQAVAAVGIARLEGLAK